MCTNDSNSGRGSKTSSPLCLPSTKRLRRDKCALGTRQITTGEDTTSANYQRTVESTPSGYCVVWNPNGLERRRVPDKKYGIHVRPHSESPRSVSRLSPTYRGLR